MKKILYSAFLLAALVVQLTNPMPGQGKNDPSESVEAVLKNVQRVYGGIDGFQANFYQVYVSNKLRREESGSLLIKKPNKMRWEYQTPVQKLFICDGKQIFFYIPEDNQVTIKKVTEEDIDFALPFLFLLKKGNPLKYFTAAWERTEPKLHERNYSVRLQPKKQHSEIESIFAEINPSSYLIERLIVLDYSKARGEFVISNFNAQVQIDNSKFSFKIPNNAEIITE